MIKYLFALLTVISQPLLSQKIPFIADWSLGDSYDFKITKTKQLWKDSKLTSNDSIQFQSTFSVIDSCDSTYTIRWSRKKNIVDTYEISEELMRKYPNFKMPDVIYKTNYLGQFIGIENWDSLSIMMDFILNESIKAVAHEKNVESQQLLDKMKSLISVLKSKEGIEKLIFNDIILIHYPFGVLLSPKKPLRYKDSYPNMLGGEPIPCKVKIAVESVDYDSSKCAFLHDVQLNPKYSKKFLADVLNTLITDDKDLKSVLKNCKYNIVDHDRFEYYYFPGIPNKIETNRTMILTFPNNSIIKFEKIKLELVDKHNVL